MSYEELWEKNSERFIWGWRTSKRRNLRSVDRRWLWKNCKEPVLDVGCGYCFDAEAFEDYTGIDVTSSFINVCREQGVTNAYCMDARNLPFADKKFETAYSKDVLLHYPHEDMMQILMQMCRVAKRVYTAWGKGGEIWNRGLNYMPNHKPLYQKKSGFWYNRHDLGKIEEEFIVILIGEGTSITEIRMK